MTMDTSIEKAMNVIMSNVTVLKCNECGSGLNYYYMEITDDKNSAKTNEPPPPPYYLLLTVTYNK